MNREKARERATECLRLMIANDATFCDYVCTSGEVNESNFAELMQDNSRAVVNAATWDTINDGAYGIAFELFQLAWAFRIKPKFNIDVAMSQWENAISKLASGATVQELIRHDHKRESDRVTAYLAMTPWPEIKAEIDLMYSLVDFDAIADSLDYWLEA